MKSELDNEELVRRFLLGELSEPERAEIEDRFLADDPFFQEILIGEDDLMDAYVRGELPAAESELFERCCLSTQHGRQRVEFARTLFNSLSGKTDTIVTAREQNATNSSWWRSLFGKFINRPALGFALAAALAVIVTGGLWLLLEKGRSRPLPAQAGRTTVSVEQPHESPLPMTAAEQEPSQPEKEIPKPAPSPETPPKTVATVTTFQLLPGMTRGEGGANSLVLPGRTTTVRLRLVLEGETYKQYRATLSTAEGKKLWGRVITKGISNKSASLTLMLPANLLNNGDYILELGGANQNGKWESVADYSFRVVKI